LFDMTNPTVAPYASLGEVRLRISAKTTSEAEAMTIIEPVAQEIIKIAGVDYFGEDKDSIAEVVGRLLGKKQETVSVAESCTGGGLGAMFTNIAGSSDYFWGGVIAYHNRVKMSLLGVTAEALDNHGAVSDTVAQQMALGVKQRLGTSWGVSITGIAGPEGGTESKPVGLVYIGIASPDGGMESVKCTFGDRDREIIRYLSSCTALDQLRRKLIDRGI
ncbi:MAG: nicotinamide-nucleotide amidohydrolase family protein, partial [Crocosphaera sp.]